MMKKVIRVSIFALLISVFFGLFGPFAFAAAPGYGMFDLTEKMNAPDVEKINSLLKAIYERNGMSFYLVNANPVEGSRNYFLKEFLFLNDIPNSDAFDKGVSVVCDGGGYGSVPFSKDRSIDAIYPPEYLNRMIPAALRSSGSLLELYESLALELLARDVEYKIGRADPLAAANDGMPNELDAPNYLNVQILTNNAGRRYVYAQFETPESVARINDNVDLLVSFNLDWKINEGPWLADMTGKITTAFMPTRTTARSIALFSDFYSDGDWGHIDVENNVYSFRAFFDFITPDGKRVISPFTDVIKLTAVK
jgi:hypothetical protein